MILGTFSKDQDVVIPLLVHSPQVNPKAIQAVVDTGFNGYLTLPRYLIEELGLSYHSQTTATLGDGSVVSLRRFEGSVDWLGRRREVMILEAEGGPLIGVSLLYGSKLTIEFVEDGNVVIESLS